MIVYFFTRIFSQHISFHILWTAINERFFLVRWCFQRTLVPSFFFFLLLSSAFFVFGLITYDWSVQTHLLLLLLWVLPLLRVCEGVRGCAQVCTSVCAGMCVCVPICKGVCGHAQGCVVWAGVHRCAQVCTGVCKSVWMSASRCMEWILRISTGE